MQEDMTKALINIPSLTNFVKSIVKEAVEEDKKRFNWQNLEY